MTQENKNKYFNFLFFLLPIICIFFVFREVIFSSKIFSHLDVLTNYIPYYNALYKAPDLIQQGISSGFPIYLSVSTTWFNPINKLLFHFFDAFDAFRFLDITYLIGAYIFTYLYAKRLQLSHYSSVLVGLVYIFSGQVMLWSATIIITSYYFLLPVVLYVLDVAFFSKKNWFKWVLFCISGVLLGMGWLSGHVQFVIYLHIFIGVYFAYEVFSSENFRDTNLITQFFPLILMNILSFIVGYPIISALINFLPVSARVGGVTLDMMSANTYLPYHLIHYLLPSFSVPYPIIPYQPAFQNYIGILPFILLIFGLLNFKKITKSRPYSRFFMWAGLFCLLASMRYSPIIYIFHYLPFLKTFREAPRIMYIGDFCLAVFIGFVLDDLIMNKENFTESLGKFLKVTRRFFLWLIVPVVAVFSFSYIFFFEKMEVFVRNYFLTHIYPHTLAGLPKEHYFNLIHSYLVIFIGQFSVYNKDVVALIIFGVLSYLLLKNLKNLSVNKFLSYAVLIVVFNFLLIYSNRIHGISRSDYFDRPTSASIIMNREKGGEPFRIFSPLNDVSIFDESTRCNFPKTEGWEMSKQEFILRKELLEPNLNMLYGVESADGYEPYIPNRMIGLMEYLGSRFAVDNTHGMGLTSENISINKKINKFAERKNILRSLNIKYVLSYFPIKDVDFQEIALDQVGVCQSPVHIYELSKTWPRYFLTDGVTILGDAHNEGEIYKTYMGELASSTKPTIFLEKPLPSSVNIPNSKGGFVSLTPKITSDSLSFTTNQSKSGYLFIGNAWLPNWHATIDGKQVEILKANYIYMALAIPAGNHEIVFKYTQ